MSEKKLWESAHTKDDSAFEHHSSNKDSKTQRLKDSKSLEIYSKFRYENRLLVNENGCPNANFSDYIKVIL
jgi:hypothetical protein